MGFARGGRSPPGYPTSTSTDPMDARNCQDNGSPSRAGSAVTAHLYGPRRGD